MPPAGIVSCSMFLETGSRIRQYKKFNKEVCIIKIDRDVPSISIRHLGSPPVRLGLSKLKDITLGGEKVTLELNTGDKIDLFGMSEKMYPKILKIMLETMKLYIEEASQPQFTHDLKNEWHGTGNHGLPLPSPLSDSAQSHMETVWNAAQTQSGTNLPFPALSRPPRFRIPGRLPPVQIEQRFQRLRR